MKAVSLNSCILKDHFNGHFTFRHRKRNLRDCRLATSLDIIFFFDKFNFVLEYFFNPFFFPFGSKIAIFVTS